MSAIYNAFVNGRGVFWSELNEEEKYEVWTLHLLNGGEDFSYPKFCEIMDKYNA